MNAHYEPLCQAARGQGSGTGEDDPGTGEPGTGDPGTGETEEPPTGGETPVPQPAYDQARTLIDLVLAGDYSAASAAKAALDELKGSMTATDWQQAVDSAVAEKRDELVLRLVELEVDRQVAATGTDLVALDGLIGIIHGFGIQTDRDTVVGWYLDHVWALWDSKASGTSAETLREIALAMKPFQEWTYQFARDDYDKIYDWDNANDAIEQAKKDIWAALATLNADNLAAVTSLVNEKKGLIEQKRTEARDLYPFLEPLGDDTAIDERLWQEFRATGLLELLEGLRFDYPWAEDALALIAQFAPAGWVPPQGLSGAAADLAAKFDALGWSAMIPHAERIVRYAEQYGVEAETIAALIWQESKGVESAVAGNNPEAGHGLMQIEWSAHSKSVMEFANLTDPEAARQWLLAPDNNLAFGVRMLKEERLDQFGTSGDGLNRAHAYWNYGAGGAMTWVEGQTQPDRDDWNYQLWKYHIDHEGYGTPTHWYYVRRNYDQLVGTEAERWSGVSANLYDVTRFAQTDPEWAGIRLNNSDGSDGTWGLYGCALTSVAELLHFYTGAKVNADLMRLIRLYCTDEWSREYLENSGDLYPEGEKTTWFLQEHFGVRLRVVDSTSYTGDTEADGPPYADLMAQLVERLKTGPVIIGAKTANNSPHYVVVKGYVGDGTRLEDFLLSDPAEANRTTLKELIEGNSLSRNEYTNIHTMIQMEWT